MSVKTLPNNQLRVVCDGPSCSGSHYDLDYTNEAMNASNERLARWGWRTRIVDDKQEHFCAYCSLKIREFSPRFKAEDLGPQKRRGHSPEGKQRMSESAKNRQQRSDARR